MRVMFSPVAMQTERKTKQCKLSDERTACKVYVLYLLAWLAGKTGCGAYTHSFFAAGKQTGFCEWQ